MKIIKELNTIEKEVQTLNEKVKNLSSNLKETSKKLKDEEINTLNLIAKLEENNKVFNKLYDELKNKKF